MMFETILKINLFSSIFENNANGYWYKVIRFYRQSTSKIDNVLNYFLVIENMFCFAKLKLLPVI